MLRSIVFLDEDRAVRLGRGKHMCVVSLLLAGCRSIIRCRTERHNNHRCVASISKTRDLEFRQSSFHRTRLVLTVRGYGDFTPEPPFPDMLWSPAGFPRLQPLPAEVSQADTGFPSYPDDTGRTPSFTPHGRTSWLSWKLVT